MGVAMATTEVTAIAEAVGVLRLDRHRPPLAHISPSAAALQREEDDIYIPTWRDLGLAVVAIIWAWAMYVTLWVLFGGAA